MAHGKKNGRSHSSANRGKHKTPGNEPKNRSKSWNDRQSRDDKRDYKRRERNDQYSDDNASRTAPADKLSSLNDFSWYSRYPVLIEGAGRIPFPYRPGQKVSIATSDAANYRPYVIPGAITIHWLPTIGYSSGSDSPASMTAREIWKQVRSSFSASLDVDPPDFMAYIMAIDSAYSYIAALKRIYMLLDWYSPNNHFIADGLLRAMRFSQDAINNLRENKADFNLGINLLIKQIQKYKLPFEMDVFKRHFWLNQNVYTDAPTINSQFYVFIQDGFYMWDMRGTGMYGTGETLASGCTMRRAPWSRSEPVVPSQSTDSAVTFLLNEGQSLLTALNKSEDVQIINGYLQRAYDGVSGFTTDELPIFTEFEAVYQPEVLAQIENAEAIFSYGMNQPNGYPMPTITGMDIWQDPATNAVYSKPSFKEADVGGAKYIVPDLNARYLSIRSDLPSVEEIVIASRLKSTIQSATFLDFTIDSAPFKIVAGSEITTKIMVHTFNVADASLVSSVLPSMVKPTGKVNTDGTVSDVYAVNDIIALLAAVSAVEAFDWTPLIYVFMDMETSSGSKFAGTSIVGDVHNLTAITTEALTNLSRICVYSEFNAFS